MEMKDKNLCGISVIIKSTGMRRRDILLHIEAGRISAERKGKQFFFSIEEQERLESLNAEYVGVFAIINNYKDGKDKFSLDRKQCRDELLEFAEENLWFGAKIVKSEEVFFADAGNEAYFVRRPDEGKFSPHLRLWLASYGESSEGKLELLLGKLHELYPETEALLRKFVERQYPKSFTAAWMLTDYLCSALTNEITQSDDESLDSLASSMDTMLPLNSARMFSAFILYLRSKRKLGSGWTYQFQSRGGAQNNDAYPVDAYFKMAYIVFNEDAWEMEGLKEKALQLEAYANLWLFIALHFICGWRGSDIVRLPMPKLPCAGKTIRKQLLDGSFDTDIILEEVELRLRYIPMKPSKTESYNVPELKLFVAESLRKPLGFILTTAASYHEDILPGGIFIRRAGSSQELAEFFGSEFVSVCESKGFSTRRANKSYLQGIESSADNTPGKPKGYILAALARSHKSGYGALPKTTEIYLRDANFSGYSPEFIAREMFERGVFSFIPALLLKMYEGSEYMKLPVSSKTKLMQEIGIRASALEGIASAVQRSLEKAHQAVSEIMSSPQEMQKTSGEILQNIASGNAPGRQNGFLCLMTAAGVGCTDPDRSCCIGCGYEIYTKTIMRLLVSEYSRLLEKKNTAEKAESDRCKTILKEAVLPAIAQMLASAERLYPDLDIMPLREEVERGLHLC